MNFIYSNHSITTICYLSFSSVKFFNNNNHICMKSMYYNHFNVYEYCIKLF